MLLLAVVLLIVPQVAGDSKCSCQTGKPMSIQNKFCEADYVIKAQVKSIKSKKNTKTLNIKITEHYKLPDHKVDTKKIVMTGKDCWMDRTSVGDDVIKNKQEYIFSGVVKGKTLTMTKCDSMSVLASKTNHNNFKSHYQDNCECQVEFVRYADEAVYSDNKCTAGLSHFRCDNQYGLCQQTDGVCDWIESASVHRCLTGQLNDAQGFLPQQVRAKKKRKPRRRKT